MIGDLNVTRLMRGFDIVIFPWIWRKRSLYRGLLLKFVAMLWMFVMVPFESLVSLGGDTDLELTNHATGSWVEQRFQIVYAIKRQSICFDRRS